MVGAYLSLNTPASTPITSNYLARIYIFYTLKPRVAAVLCSHFFRYLYKMIRGGGIGEVVLDECLNEKIR